MKKKNVLFLLGCIAANCYAGLNGLTIHSRANCINNESVSWHWRHNYILATESLHAWNGVPDHWTGTGWEYTWRSAAVDWFEVAKRSPLPLPLWYAEGHHHIKDCPTCNIRELGNTNATDCSGYDGWWNFNMPREIKMKNKLGGILLLSLASLNAEAQKIPKHRIQIVSEAEFYKDYPPEMMKLVEDQKKQEKEKGYYDFNGEASKTLLSMQYGDMVAAQKRSVKNVNDWNSPYDTHLKYNISDVKLAFNHKKLNIPEIQKVIGYAPLGMYIPAKGWTGIVSFYNMKNLGVCKLELFNIDLSNGQVKVEEGKAKYEVNNKSSSTLITGNPNDGFIYTVSWDDETYIHDFRCATKGFNPDMINKMIPVAIKIDRQIDSLG